MQKLFTKYVIMHKHQNNYVLLKEVNLSIIRHIFLSVHNTYIQFFNSKSETVTREKCRGI